MLFERIVSAGISHFSYFLADDSYALVIDPRTDTEVYLNSARENNLQITNIIETHRHEDFICGSKSWHKVPVLKSGIQTPSGTMLRFPVSDGQTWNIGKLKLESITSRHTPDK